MLSAAHAEAMKHGDVILSADLLTRIYQAMNARKPRVSMACPVCAASMVPCLGELGAAPPRQECDCKAADMPFGRCCKVDK
jgi:hypothetical protein